MEASAQPFVQFPLPTNAMLLKDVILQFVGIRGQLSDRDDDLLDHSLVGTPVLLAFEVRCTYFSEKDVGWSSE